MLPENNNQSVSDHHQQHPLIHFAGQPTNATFQQDATTTKIHHQPFPSSQNTSCTPIIHTFPLHPQYNGPLPDDLKSEKSRRSHSSTSSFSSLSSSGSSSRTSSSGSESGKLKGKRVRRVARRTSSEAPLAAGQLFNQNPNVQSMMMGGPHPTAMQGHPSLPPGPSLEGFPPGVGPRGSHFPGGGAALYGYPSPILGHQPSPLGAGLPQFGGMLSSLPGLNDPSPYGAPPLFTGPRGGIRPGFHSSGQSRFMVEGSAPHLADETLQTYPNAAAAPNRLPAHKPVRLTQPKHPLAPPGTPVYFKYGEEHYPEETVPPEYTFTETDGTVCRYITNFLVYNKRGERLLPIEVLDQPRHAALVLYGSLLPAAAMSQTNPRGKHADEDGTRSKKRTAGTSAGGMSKRHASGQGGTALGREGGGRKKNEMDRWVAERGGVPGGVNQTYPVRVELAEWCIDYGQEPCNVPFIWLISRWDVYYRLEKPAGRYIPTFATAKMKFEVSTRVIKTLQYRPDTEYRTLVDLLTAATRHERYQKKIERKAQLKKERRHREQLMLKGSDPLDDPNSHLHDSTKLHFADPTSALGIKHELELFDTKGTSDVTAANSSQTKKKNRNWRIQSLSTPQGTGVVVADEDGRPQATTPWGAPYAVEGFKESMLLGLAEFLESQLRNFMEGVGGIGDGGCPNLLNTPFMRTLREKTALRMETLQLVEAKRRALEVAKSLAEAASGHPGPLIDPTTGMLTTTGELSGMPTGADYLGYQHASGPNGFGPRPSPPGAFYATDMAASTGGGYFSPNGLNLLGQGMLPTGAGGIAAADGIHALETEIHHLQQLLKDSDDDEDDEDDDDEDSSHDERSDGSSSDNDNNHHHRRGGSAGGSGNTGAGGMNHQGMARPADLHHSSSSHHHTGSSGHIMHQHAIDPHKEHLQQQGFRLAPDGETINSSTRNNSSGTLLSIKEKTGGPCSLDKSHCCASSHRPQWLSDGSKSPQLSQLQDSKDGWSLSLFEGGIGMAIEARNVTMESVSWNRRGEIVEDKINIKRKDDEKVLSIDTEKLCPTLTQAPNVSDLNLANAMEKHSQSQDTRCCMKNMLLGNDLFGVDKVVGCQTEINCDDESTSTESIATFSEFATGEDDHLAEPFSVDVAWPQQPAAFVQEPVVAAAIPSSPQLTPGQQSTGFASDAPPSVQPTTVLSNQGIPLQSASPIIHPTVAQHLSVPVSRSSPQLIPHTRVLPQPQQLPPTHRPVSPMSHFAQFSHHPQSPFHQYYGGYPNPATVQFATMGFQFPPATAAFAPALDYTTGDITGRPFWPGFGSPAWTQQFLQPSLTHQRMSHPRPPRRSQQQPAMTIDQNSAVIMERRPKPDDLQQAPTKKRRIVASQQENSISHEGAPIGAPKTDKKKHRHDQAAKGRTPPELTSTTSPLTVEQKLEKEAMTKKRQRPAKPKPPSTISVRIAVPPFPRDILDDIDIAITDMRYYRSPIPLDQIEIYKHPKVLEVVDFLEIISDWLSPSVRRQLVISPLELEKIIGVSRNDDQSGSKVFNFLLAELLRLYCRRFERLRPPEVQLAQSEALKEFEVKDQDALDESMSSSTITITSSSSLIYRAWLPGSVTSKQPPQVLSSRGWVNVCSSYAPVEAFLSQPTLRALARLHSELRALPRYPQISDIEPSGVTDSGPPEALERSLVLLDKAMGLVTHRDVNEAFINISLSDVYPVVHRLSKLRPPRTNDLSLGLISGIQWPKDEGSINEITWELYLRLALWDSLCDVAPEILRQRRVEAESQHSKKKKKTSTKSSCQQTSKSFEATMQEQRSEANINDEKEIATTPVEEEEVGVIEEANSHVEGVQGEPISSKATNDVDEIASEAGSVEDESEISEIQRTYWSWDIDLKKAQNGGIDSGDSICRMEKLMKALLGVGSSDNLSESALTEISEHRLADVSNNCQGNVNSAISLAAEPSISMQFPSSSANGVGWWAGLTTSDRVFLLNWIISQISKSPLGRDMVERRIEIFNFIKAYLTGLEKLVAQPTKSNKTSKGKRQAKQGAKGKSKNIKTTKLASAELTSGIESARVEESSAVKVTPIEASATVAESEEENGFDEMKRVEAGDEDMKVDSALTTINEKVADETAQDNLTASEKVSSDHDKIDDDMKETPVVAIETPLTSETDPLVSSSQQKVFLTREGLVAQLDALSRRFRIRRECLGEDRYLNRYFHVPMKNGHGMVLIEIHVLIPVTPKLSVSSSTTYREITVEHKRLPVGIAAYSDVNFRLPESAEPFTASISGQAKHFGLRGRPRKFRIQTPRRAKAKKENGSTETNLEIKTEDQPSSIATDGVEQQHSEDIKGSDTKSVEAPSTEEIENQVTIGESPISENLNIRRSGRSTKGQRKGPTYLDDASIDDEQKRTENTGREDDEEKVQQPSEETEEMKAIRKKGVIFATFLSPIKRSKDDAVFMRRPLNGRALLNPITIDCQGDYEGSLTLRPAQNNIEDKTELYEGPFRPIPPVKRRKKNAEGLFEEQPSEPKQSETIIIETGKYIPIIQWGAIRSTNLVKELMNSLSDFSIRENRLKHELARLLEENSFMSTVESPSNGTDALPENMQPSGVRNAFSNIHVLARSINLAQHVLEFKSLALDLGLCVSRFPEYLKFRMLCDEIHELLSSLEIEVLTFNAILQISATLQRTVIFLILLISKFMRSSPSFKLTTPIPSSGWNIRSSPNQWESELKAIDWSIAQLCSPNGIFMNQFDGSDESNQLKKYYQQEVLEIIGSRTRPTSISLSSVGYESDVSSVLYDFASLIGLYFTIWIRFGVNRVPLEHLLSNTTTEMPINNKPVSADLIPRIGDVVIFKKKVYVHQFQILKNWGVPAIDEWLPPSLQDGDKIRILQVSYHKYLIQYQQSSQQQTQQQTPVLNTNHQELSTSKLKKKDSAKLMTPAPPIVTSTAAPSSSPFESATEYYIRLRCTCYNDNSSNIDEHPMDDSSSCTEFILCVQFDGASLSCLHPVE